MLLTVTMIVVGMLAASATGALAAPKKLTPAVLPGPNSDQPLINELIGPGNNFGRCQSMPSFREDPANSAQVDNPAILTQGEPIDEEVIGQGSFCPKA
jgi:hypothetical protein